jgi:F5/8 type C domain
MRCVRRREAGRGVALAIVLMLLGSRAEGQSVTLSSLNSAEDLNFSGTVIYAVNFGDNGSPVVGGIRFSQDEALSGVTHDAQGEGPATTWGPYPGTADDALNELLNGMAYRLDGPPNIIRINMSGLMVGKSYLLQLIGYEPAEEDRDADIIVENEVILTDVNPIDEQGGVVGESGFVVKYAFVAGDSTLNIRIQSEINACAISAVILASVPAFEAAAPDPEDGATDVFADVLLGWTPGQYAVGHDVYLGTSLADVNTADRDNSVRLLVSESQDASTYDPPGRLDWGQTYYWRVDEVNGAPDYTIHQGEPWSFTVEPFSCPIENIVATSNTPSEIDEGPENTVNGSGLNAGDEHSLDSDAMWLVTADGDPVYIQYEFDRLYKLHEMRVWNYNEEFELILGIGLKDVAIEYSEDGVDWRPLGEVQLAQATARPDYTPNTTVDLEALAARYVRLTVNSGWSLLGQFGLSEVRFLYIPVQATRPVPSAGETDVSLTSVLSWRAGREAAAHDVCIGATPETLAPIETVGDSRYLPDGLEFGSTYYWKVDEVNEAEAVSCWDGDLWSFSTVEFVAVEDFEGYGDDENLIYETWIDGWTNETGSTVGYPEAPFAEQEMVHGGGQSMPLQYDNAAAPFYSEAERDLGGANWSANGADTLSLYVAGKADNDPVAFYVAVEDTAGQIAVATHADGQIALTTDWQEWLIPFGEFAGVNLSSVRAVYIGLGDRTNPSAGGTGLIFIDDIAVGHPASVQ